MPDYVNTRLKKLPKGKLSMKELLSVNDFNKFQAHVKSGYMTRKHTVLVCMTGCRAYGASDVMAAVRDEVDKQGMTSEVEVRSTGCHGFCARAPVVAIEPMGIQYQEVTPDDAVDIVALSLKKGDLIDRLAYRDIKSNTPVHIKNEIPFYDLQERRILKKCGRIDPEKIEHYIAEGGYTAISTILAEQTPEDVIDTMIVSNLKGRGGAGFPTGLKWKFARASTNLPKYIICNADEGDPGAFMDRAILEGDPHAVLEGLLIGAFAMGSEYGYIYVREEYPIAIDHLETAIEQAEKLGLLGNNILGSGFNFHLSLKKGAGAFVCGEETALMASIEGKRGMPRTRPPFPAQAGVDGKPSNINNVETLANVPLIFKNGEKWYRSVGTENSSGTKIFSLAGKVNNTGLVEVPIGTTVKKVVFDIGGGVPKGRKFKSVQMGGPSGGCVPAQFLNTPIDYDTISRIGAIMGSGGMVVMDENNCMVEIARFFLSFTQSESCGKCIPCRLGTTQLLDILTKITQGKGSMKDIQTIKDIGHTITESALCGLGQTCAKPALSTLKYFLDEYEDHIVEHRCSGATCDSMVISPCQHACPAGIDVPNYIAAAAVGHYEKAVQIIRERNPFPAVCGRVCINPCEFKCRRGELDDPLAIRSIKRFVSDWYFDNIGTMRDPFPVTQAHKVAIVGAGPSGLTCAYFLAEMGYTTTVFETQNVGGGMLGIALPEFRLPRHVIEQEIEYIKNCGVDIRYNSPVDANNTVDDLLKQDYGAVFIAAGAQSSKKIGIPGEEQELKGVHYGLQFLHSIRKGNRESLAGKTIVIGGGNVAIDVARAAVRVGSTKTQLYCLEADDEMPAWEKDIEEALEEGVIINPSWGPVKLLYKNGHVTGVRFKKCVSVFDLDGKFNPAFDTKNILDVPAENVIISIGQAPDVSFLTKDSQLERAVWGSLKIDKNTLTTSVPGVFAGGDFTSGPTFVIKAIASGRRAAIAIHEYLSGRDGPIRISDIKTKLAEKTGLALEQEIQNDVPRVVTEMESAEKRVSDFREVERGFSESQVRQEALRCLRCDLEKEVRES